MQTRQSVMNAFKATMLAVLVTGCATGYQPRGASGGYSETQLDKNVFQVSYNGNGYTSGEQAEDFVMLRAAELTLSHGYAFFSIIRAKDVSSRGFYTTPSNTYSNGSVTSFGNTAYGNVSTTTIPGQTIAIDKPGTIKLIECYVERPTTHFAYDAKFLYESIGSKYGIRDVASASSDDVHAGAIQSTTQAPPASNLVSAPPLNQVPIQENPRPVIPVIPAAPKKPATAFEIAMETYNANRFSEAVVLFKPLAKGGDTIAQVMLGNIYGTGRDGVPQDAAESFFWYRQAAEAGNTDAQNNLALMYQTGGGVTANKDLAIEWYKRAADAGNTYAMNNIGLMIENGEGVERNLLIALKWYEKAAGLGSADGKANVDRLTAIINGK